MVDLTISEIIAMQKELKEKYKGKWLPLTPENGRSSLLWMIEELGEVISIIKKRGDDAIMEEPDVREVFVEELVDMMMYFHDTLICYDISPEAFSKAYFKKHTKNMNQDFFKEHSEYLKQKK